MLVYNDLYVNLFMTCVLLQLSVDDGDVITLVNNEDAYEWKVWRNRWFYLVLPKHRIYFILNYYYKANVFGYSDTVAMLIFRLLCKYSVIPRNIIITTICCNL